MDGRVIEVTAQVTPEEAAQLRSMAKATGVSFAVMAGAAIRQALRAGRSSL